MALAIEGSGLTIEQVVEVARHDREVAFSPEAEKRIEACREFVEKKLAAGEVMYGINTGSGEFSETMLDDDEVKEFQRFLIYNHAAGIGDPAPREYVRAAMVARMNVHANGRSGLRLEVARLQSATGRR